MHWLTLLLAFQQALWIDVPFIHQDKNGCGSAVIWMVMKYWQSDVSADVGRIQSELYSKEADGIYSKEMVRYFDSHGYRTFTFKADWSDLEQHIGKGRPLIVALERNRRGVLLHYVVVAGIDSSADLVLVNDPAQRKLLSLSRSDFETSWRATDNWTLLVVPELDLASTAFRDDNLTAAVDHLNSALRVNPSDAYTNDFLATAYFLQNNTEAALKHWNRAGKPLIQNINIDPPLRTDPVLLDRAFAFSRGSILRLSDFEDTEARLSALGVFSRYRMDLTPSGDEAFDVTLRATERSRGNPLSWIGGVPFQTVQPEFSNLGGRGINIATMLRWDANKRRVFGSVEAPMAGNPQLRYGLSVDGRDEIWSGYAGDFRMKKISAALEIQGTPSGRWAWTSGASLSSRHFSNSFAGGVGLKYTASATHTVVREPSRDLKLNSSIAMEVGKLWNADNDRFLKLVNTTELRWRAVTSQVRLGRSLGRIPFDERFTIGLDRDTDLWLRAHPALLMGRKNASNTAGSFVLTNSDFQKTLVNTGWLQISSGPFLDTGKSSISERWLFDTGAELRVRVLGSFGMRISYGRSLTDASHAVFIRPDAH